MPTRRQLLALGASMPWWSAEVKARPGFPGFMSDAELAAHIQWRLEVSLHYLVDEVKCRIEGDVLHANVRLKPIPVESIIFTTTIGDPNE